MYMISLGWDMWTVYMVENVPKFLQSCAERFQAVQKGQVRAAQRTGDCSDICKQTPQVPTPHFSVQPSNCPSTTQGLGRASFFREIRAGTFSTHGHWSQWKAGVKPAMGTEETGGHLQAGLCYAPPFPQALPFSLGDSVLSPLTTSNGPAKGPGAFVGHPVPSHLAAGGGISISLSPYSVLHGIFFVRRVLHSL